MTVPALSYDDLKALNPCEESFRRVTRLMGGARKWNGKKVTAKQARKAGATFDAIVWAASALARTDKDTERRLRLWHSDCAARVLHIFENQSPSDSRPRKAIVTMRQFAHGETSDATRAAAWDAAWDAAGSAAGAAAWDAARDAAWAAARAAAGAAAWEASSAEAWAAARAAAWEASSAAARDAEGDWQFDRLILWLSEKEPEDWPLQKKPANKKAA